LAKVPRYSKADVKSVMAAITMIKEERNRRLAIRLAPDVAVAEEAREEGDVCMAANDPTVPQRTAVDVQPSTPYASIGQASPQTLFDKTIIIPVSIAPSEDPEVLRYSFFKCEEAKWSDPHWIASPKR
jgi:hypothetical protein